MKKLMGVIALLLLMPFMVACERENTQKVVLAEVTHSVFYAPQYVALTEGFFEEVGLEVELINANGADKVSAALLSGDCHIGLAGLEATVYVYNQGQKDYFVNFAQLTQKDGNFLLGRHKIDDFKFSMLKNSSILGGRRGGMPEMVLEYALKLNGLEVGRDDESKEVNVRTDVQFAALAGAFMSGEGDYVTLFEPTATNLVKSGKGYILASLGEETGIVPYTNYFCAKSYLEKNSETIQKFTDAINKAAKWVYDHSALEIATACHPYFTDTTIEDLTIVMQRYMDIEAWAKTPILLEETYNRFLTIMEAAGELTSRTPYEAIVTKKFTLNYT